MSNNRNDKESWERDTLRMKPVRVERSDANTGSQAAPSRSSGRKAEASFYAEDDGNSKAKLVIGIIAAIIVVLSLVLMYLDMVEKNGANTDADDAPVYEDTTEYENSVEKPEAVTEEAVQEEEKPTEDEKQQPSEEQPDTGETEPSEPEKEDNSEALKPEDTETSTPESDPEPEPEPEQTPPPEVSTETPDAPAAEMQPEDNSLNDQH